MLAPCANICGRLRPGRQELEVHLHLQGKSVLVTGSSKGIGLAIAEAFLFEGADVAFNGRNSQDLERVVAGQPMGNSIAVCGDVSKPESARKVVERC